MSIVWVGELLGAATTSASLGGITYTGTNITPFVCLEVKRNSTGNNLVVNNSIGGSPRSIVSAGAYTTGWVVLVSAVVSNRQVFYIRTATAFERITATVAGGLAVTSTARLEIGDSFNARNPNAICSLQAMASRAWSDKECESILADPWGQLFSPRPVFLPMAEVGGAYTLTADAGAFVISGQDATLLKSKVVAADAGAYVIAGQDATLTYTPAAGAYTLTCDAGAFALAGQDATLTYTPLNQYTLTCDAGAYSIGGKDAEFVFSGASRGIVGGGGWLPALKRRTKKELDEERRRLGILPPEVVEEIAAAPVARRRITLQDLIGKKAAAQVTNVDLSAAVAASKRRRDDELLLLM